METEDGDITAIPGGLEIYVCYEKDSYGDEEDVEC